MSPIPKANEPGNNPKASDQAGEELDPPPQTFQAVLHAGDMSSDDEGSEEEGGGVEGEYGGYQLLTQDPEPLDGDSGSEDEPEETADAEKEIVHTEPLAVGQDADDFADFEFKLPSGSSSSSDGGQASEKQPDLPAHLAKLLPKAPPGTDPTSVVPHTDTHTSLAQRKQTMAEDDQIRAAMSGFSLPRAAIPAWASAVDEDRWKEQLVARIHVKQEEKPARTESKAGSGGKRRGAGMQPDLA